MGNSIADASHQMYDLGGGNYGGVNPAHPTPTLFSDNFDSGDIQNTNGQLNTANYVWGQKNNVWLVTDDTNSLPAGTDGEILQRPSDGTPGPTPIVVGKNWVGLDTVNSARMKYSGTSEDSNSEFWFTLDVQPDIWIRWSIRVPTNYNHFDSAGPDNNKFFSIWSDAYSGAGNGSTCFLSMEPNIGDTDLGISYSDGNGSGSNGNSQVSPFITTADDKGKWMHMVLHVKYESSPLAADGVMETWRRWDTEPNFTKIHDVPDVPLKLPDSGNQGFRQGWFMGWSNSGYVEETDWLIGKVEFSDQPLVPML